jgi:hypothetical protein
MHIYTSQRRHFGLRLPQAGLQRAQRLLHLSRLLLPPRLHRAKLLDL